LKTLRTVLILALVLTAGAAQAQRLSVTASVANIRSGPGTNYQIIWKVEKYHPFHVIETSGAWYHFRDFENDKGWIHKSLTGKIPSVITNRDECNIRSGPGTTYDILFKVEKGIPFKVIGRQGKWIHLEHADGDRGWIHSALVW
jgi:SH3-like domain-containing protein